MDEDRFAITDELWEQMRPLLPDKVGDPEALAALLGPDAEGAVVLDHHASEGCVVG